MKISIVCCFNKCLILSPRFIVQFWLCMLKVPYVIFSYDNDAICKNLLLTKKNYFQEKRAIRTRHDDQIVGNSDCSFLTLHHVENWKIEAACGSLGARATRRSKLTTGGACNILLSYWTMRYCALNNDRESHSYLNRVVINDVINSCLLPADLPLSTATSTRQLQVKRVCVFELLGMKYYIWININAAINRQRYLNRSFCNTSSFGASGFTEGLRLFLVRLLLFYAECAEKLFEMMPLSRFYHRTARR